MAAYSRFDGAFAGSPQNLGVIKDIASQIDIPFQVGGGLRTEADVEKVLQAGATRVIGHPGPGKSGFCWSFADRFGPEKIVLGLDARQGMVAVKGWVEVSSVRAVDLAQQMRIWG